MPIDHDHKSTPYYDDFDAEKIKGYSSINYPPIPPVSNTYSFTVPDYKFREPEILHEISEYIHKTYSAHYAKTKLQAFEEIVDNGYGLGFAMGNVTKYNKRFGKKSGKNRDDLLKQIHYAILALYAHDYEVENEETKDSSKNT